MNRYIIIPIIIWSLIPLYIKVFVSGESPLFDRAIAQIIVGFIYFIFLIRKRKTFKINKEIIKLLIISGTASILYGAGYWLALKNGNPIIADFFKTLWVIVLYLITHKNKNLLLILITIIGIFLMTYSPSIAFSWWSFLALGSAFMFPIRIKSVEKISIKMNDILIPTALAEMTSAILWIPSLYLIDIPTNITYSIQTSLFYALFFSIPSMYLYQKSREEHSIIKSMSPALLPLFSSIILYYVLDITLSMNMIIGGSLIISSLIYIKLKDYNEE